MYLFAGSLPPHKNILLFFQLKKSILDIKSYHHKKKKKNS